MMRFAEPISIAPTPKAFRYRLKYFLDVAVNEPARVQRRSGGSFVVMNEFHYKCLIQELISLQKQAIHSHRGFGRASR